jgi:thiamine kinase-like enzyme
MTLSLEEAISRVPFWKGKKNVIKTTALGGGITNNNFKVEVDGEAFVLRITGARTELLGIDRENEYAANLQAGKLGIAPEVIYFIRPEGYLVTRFLDANPLLPPEITTNAMIEELAHVLKQVHAMPPVPGKFNVFRVVEEYIQTVRDHQVTFPNDFDWIDRHAQDAEKALAANPYTPVPCHNDLLNANFLFDGNIRILDWEYAGMGDAFFDLANFSVHHQLTDEQERWLLRCYLGEQNQRDWGRLKILKTMSDFREAMWALIQVAVSSLDFDFRGYANKHFERMKNNMRSPVWDQWIMEANKHG